MVVLPAVELTRSRSLLFAKHHGQQRKLVGRATDCHDAAHLHPASQ